ncbi:hypothetical protein P153DRAFT_370699 [Dothidotthia symphoricarpi CBS 119687]|uniref:Uncharacterized protein n=1 Tax=Dothidotthia symphoricarpi CBS 119687 TaxID=1392245 RepID=A0A6A5ZYY5_9PLEO|nr:uncharacterized protein P153DRAFT_370699 [Dothidotthia symphoricarpi CBS 119687]KAF2124790.1 hypothetical protein P153DRAFT_370699 [Dothidotthia symphoricarpi CBS 119687]
MPELPQITLEWTTEDLQQHAEFMHWFNEQVTAQREDVARQHEDEVSSLHENYNKLIIDVSESLSFRLILLSQHLYAKEELRELKLVDSTTLEYGHANAHEIDAWVMELCLKMAERLNKDYSRYDQALRMLGDKQEPSAMRALDVESYQAEAYEAFQKVQKQTLELKRLAGL